jgi:SAM-dependent methyltransferase
MVSPGAVYARCMPISRFELYTLCAQNTARDARLLRAIALDASRSKRRSARKPFTLGEDFSGAAALAAAWCELGPRHHAVAIDRDPEPHDHARARRAPHPRLTLRTGDVLRATAPADIIAATNFSICELHTRTQLLKYLRRVLARLNPGGVFVCDLYGGSDAFFTGTISQRFALPDRRAVRYDWEQRTTDPTTGMVTNAMHFRVAASPKRRDMPAEPALSMHDAFVYRWRLWTMPELRDAMHEAGFRSSAIYPRTAGAIDQHGELYSSPITTPEELGDAFNIFVVGSR